MQRRNCVEVVNRTLHNICHIDKPFEGITIVLRGDFRQILSCVPKGACEQIVAASLRCSTLWNNIRVLHLDSNMHLNTLDPRNASFGTFFMEVYRSSTIANYVLFMYMYYKLLIYLILLIYN